MRSLLPYRPSRKSLPEAVLLGLAGTAAIVAGIREFSVLTIMIGTILIEIAYFTGFRSRRITCQNRYMKG